MNAWASTEEIQFGATRTPLAATASDGAPHWNRCPWHEAEIHRILARYGVCVVSLNRSRWIM